VTRDIPADSVAVGNPARVIRTLTRRTKPNSAAAQKIIRTKFVFSRNFLFLQKHRKKGISAMHSEQAAPDLLQKSLDASGVGWWQLDFGQREMTCSRLAADLFGADRTRISFEEVYLLPGEEHRARIYTRCAALKVSDSLDETFVTANGDRCLQVRAVAAANDPLTGVRSVFGTVRRVTEGTPENAELASINQSYKATQRNYSHLAQLIEHLPIGYLRDNILRDKSGEAVDYLLSYINQQAGRILGIHTQGHAGKTAREVGIDPLKHIPTFEHIPSCSFWEQTGKSPDGKRTCRCLIYNTPGDDDELVILLEDITDATRSREQLDDFEHLFNLVSDFAHVGCVSYNPLTGEGYTKGPWAKNYGEAENTPASQILGHWRQVHPDDRQHLEEEFERLKNRRNPDFRQRSAYRERCRSRCAGSKSTCSAATTVRRRA